MRVSQQTKDFMDWCDGVCLHHDCGGELVGGTYLFGVTRWHCTECGAETCGDLVGNFWTERSE